MSTAVLERPVVDEADWVVLEDVPQIQRQPEPLPVRSPHGVELRGRGRDHHGVLAPGRLAPVGPDRTPAPPVDELDF